MSEYHFGVGRGKIPASIAKKIHAVASKHGAAFVNTYIPGDGYRYWFSGPNYGQPFDQALARTVDAALTAASLQPENWRMK